MAKPGDADFSGQATAGRDGSILILGMGGGMKWIDADFTGDGLVTAGADGSMLISALSTGLYDTATDGTVAEGSAGTAQVTWNPATG